ncbi:uncharacterized protein PAC_19101, partial [Phialocephala subalpina]
PQPANTLGSLPRTPQGISYSNNKYEGDSSIGCNDAYLASGDAHSLNITRFIEVYALGLDKNESQTTGSVNGVNTYAGVNLTDLTAGTYNLDTLFEGDNFACFSFQTQDQAVPDVSKNGLNVIADAVGLINKYSNNILAESSCPQLAGYDDSLFNSYTGRTYSQTGSANNH